MRPEARGRDILAEAPGDGEQDAVVQLPAVELLEAEELSDLEIDDSQPLDSAPMALARSGSSNGWSGEAPSRRRRPIAPAAGGRRSFRRDPPRPPRAVAT